MEPLRISAVSYLNAFPMVCGVKHWAKTYGWTVQLKLPAVSAQEFLAHKVDLALMPIGALAAEGLSYQLAADFCVGAEHEVYSVCLLSNQPVEKLHTIYLDTASRTSVLLARILASKLWHIAPQWLPATPEVHPDALPTGAAMVAIGDKVFALRRHYTHIHDLAVEWRKLTGLPCVFAAWVSQHDLPQPHRDNLHRAIAWGLANYQDLLPAQANALPCPLPEALRYLHENIDYPLTPLMQKSMARYLAEGKALQRRSTP